MFIKWTLQDKNMYSYCFSQEKWNCCQRNDTSFNKHFFQLCIRCDVLQLRALNPLVTEKHTSAY